MRSTLLLLSLLTACSDALRAVGAMDADADGYASDVDCDDGNREAFPGARESCDGIDNDCDGAIDEAAWDATTYFRDADGDGFGGARPILLACTQPDGFVLTAGDCDDQNAATYPQAPEICDGVDNDCDPTTLADAGGVTQDSWFADRDGDGFGDPAVRTMSCVAPDGYVRDGSDCDDGNGGVNPAAMERCGPIDEDCDPATGDEVAADTERWFPDADRDGFGRSDAWIDACEAPVDHVAAGGDCDDTDPLAYPGAPELCAAGDQDCDPLTTDAEAHDRISWFRDADGDGFGDGLAVLKACEQPDGYLPEPGDCDDSNGDVNPDGVEVCDGIDNDCDPSTVDLDDPIAREVFYDGDGDGYGDPSRVAVACGEPRDGYVADATDCDDTEPLRNPGLVEICGDGLDNDCLDIVEVCGVLGDASLADAAVDVAVEAIAAVAIADTDADGLMDLAVGSPTDSFGGPDSGAVYVFSGPLEGTRVAGDEVALLVGRAGDSVGAAVIPYDADADGRFEWLVGAPGAGEVYVVPAGTTGVARAASVASGTFMSESALAPGAAMASAGELAFVGELGAVVAVRGLGGALADSPRVIGSAEEGVGTRLAAGDIDGDGLADVVVGAPGADAVWVALGPHFGAVLLDDAAAWVSDAEPGSSVGARVASGADVDGDGNDDVVVGDETGQAWLIGVVDIDTPLSTAATRVTGLGSGGLAILDDVDADGVGEVFVTDELAQPTRIPGPLGPGVLDLSEEGVWVVREPGLGATLGGSDVDDDGINDLWATDGSGLWMWLGKPGL